MHLRPLGQLSTSIFQSVFPTNKNSFKKLLGRKTGKKTKNYSIFKFENPNKIKVFLRTKLPNGLKFSSQPRYDHFDTSPYKIVKAKPKPKLRENCEMQNSESANARGVNADK